MSSSTTSQQGRTNYLCTQNLAKVIQLLRARPYPSKGGDSLHVSKMLLISGGIEMISFDTIQKSGIFTLRVLASSTPPVASTPHHKRGSSLSPSSSQPSYIARRGSGAVYTGRSSSGLHSPPPLPESTGVDDLDIFDYDPENAMLLETWTFDPTTFVDDARTVADVSQEATLARVLCSYCTMHPIPESPYRRITVKSGSPFLRETDNGDEWLTKKWNLKNNSKDCLTVTRRFPAKYGPMPPACEDPSEAKPRGTTADAALPMDSTDSVTGTSQPQSSANRDRTYSRISPMCGPSVGRLTNTSFGSHPSPPLYPGSSSQYINPIELPAAAYHSRTNSGGAYGSLLNSFDGSTHHTMAVGSTTRTARLSSGSSPQERVTTPQSLTMKISVLAEKLEHALKSAPPQRTDVEEEFRNLQLQAPLHRLH